jgi:hypothetical protein
MAITCGNPKYKQKYMKIFFLNSNEFISVNDTFHRKHNFIVDINLSYYYSNMFRLGMVIFRPNEL